MLWIKEVEMVEPVDDLKSSRSIRGTQGPDFEVLDAKIASALNRFGFVQYGDSSEEGWTCLSQIEDNGKKKYRAEFENEVFWGQKWKIWNKRRGQKIRG